MYEHTPTESSKGGTFLYLNKNFKSNLRKDLNIYHKGMIESTLVEIMNKNEKNMMVGCIYKHPKQIISDFLNSHLLSVLEKLSHENKQILIMGDFIINLLNYDKNTSNFLDKIKIYDKTMLNLAVGNISSVISDHLIQFLIEPSSTNAKLERTCKPQDTIRTLMRQNLKITYLKSTGKNTAVIQIQVTAAGLEPRTT